ncbi:DUF4352 domain-containing protein, partial [Bacillus cereus group sp. BceL133]
MKKPFYKKWWFWVIVVIVVLGAYGNSTKDKEETKTASTEPKQEAKQETKKDEPKKEEAKTEPKKEEPKKELSKEGESSKVKIAVGSVESTDSVGGQYL